MRKLRGFKKVTTVFTAAVLTMAMGMSAYAGTIDKIGGEESTPVTGTYTEGSGSTTVYKVDITWGSMDFTYTTAGEGTWDPESHTYSGGRNGSWSSTAAGAGDITVTNHSNAAVKATLAFASAAPFSDVKGSFTTNDLPLADASVASAGAPAEAPTASSTLSLSGDPGTFATGTTLGTVTVTISAGN